MHPQQHQADLRPFVSARDFEMIISAIGAYSHNTEYRDLRDRLHFQAVTWGVITPSSPKKRKVATK